MRLNWLIAGGLVVGALDFLDAVVFFGLWNGATPIRIGQSPLRRCPTYEKLLRVLRALRSTS